MQDSSTSGKTPIKEVQELRARKAKLERVGSDITERTKTEEKLRQSEQRFRSIFDNANDIIGFVNTTGKIIEVNKKVADILGYGPDELVGKNFMKCGILPIKNAPTIIRLFKELVKRVGLPDIEGDGRNVIQLGLRHKKGHTVFVEASTTAIKTEGKLEGFLSVLRDITERKKAEEALRESEQKLRLLFEGAYDLISLADANAKTLWANPAWRKIFGAESEYQTDPFSCVHPDDLERVAKAWQGLISGAATIKNLEYRYKVPKGQYLAFESCAYPVVVGEDTLYYVIAKDITERKKAEEALRESEKRYRDIFNSVTDAIFILDLEDHIVDANPEACKMFGYSRDEMIGLAAHKLVHPDYRRKPEEFRDEIETKGRIHFEAVNLRKDGTPLNVAVRGTMFAHNGKKQFLVTLRNVTERKRAEEAWSKVNKCFLSFSPNPDDNIDKIVETAGFVLQGTCALYNKEEGALLCTRAGWNIPEDLKREDTKVGHICFDVISRNRDEPFVVNNVDKTHYAKSDSNVVKYGLKTYVGCAVKTDSKAIGCLCVVYQQDKTIGSNELKILSILAKVLGVEEGRKRAEEALGESQQQKQAILDSIPDIAWLKDKEGRYIAANEALCKAFGVKLEDLVGKTDFDISPEDLAKRYRADDEEVVKSGKRKRVEEPWGKKSGKRIWIETIKTPIYNNRGEVVGTSGIARDITERKKAEEALRESEERFRQFFENEPEYCYMISPEGVILDVNSAALKAVGYKEEELIGKPLKTIYAPESLVKMKQLFAKWKKTEHLKDEELVIITKEGNRRVVLLSADVVKDKNGKVVHSVSVQRDITERKYAEQRLLQEQAKLKSLASQLTLAEERERRRIATELHDRIGQSLAISKMNLEALRKSEYGKKTDETLDEICNLLAQTIADTRTLTFDLSSPILYELGFETAVAEWLTEQIQDKHGIATEFEDDGRPKPLDDDIRVLLFRNVRELLINVVKHAHAHKVKVSIRKVGRQICVSVEDDGVGFDPAVVAPTAAKRPEFGLFSIRQRLEELGGHLEIDSEPGLGCRVTMTAPLKQK